jgi:penicillin-binding protein 1A
MQKLGFITTQEYERAKKEKLIVLDFVRGTPIRRYILEWIRVWAENIWGKETLYHKGLIIQTSINLDVQAAAEKSFTSVVTVLRTKLGDGLNGGLMSMEPFTGQIKACVGGFNFMQSQFNRAFQARRQMGSSFKPYIYAYGIERGIELDQIMVDEPIELVQPDGQTWTPKNWNNKFEGPMTLARALTLSNNIITIKLFLDLGIKDVAQWIKRFGFKNSVPPYPSAALGTTEVSVEENCAAFNVFAANGIYVKPYLVEWVKDEWGSKLWEYQPVKYRVLSSKVASKMINALSHRMVLNKQTSRLGWFDADSIGKTGSTNGAATTWFVGATPDLTTTVYVGRDDNKPMGTQVFASATAFPVWLGLYNAISHKKKNFYIDPGLVETSIDWYTGISSTYQPMFNDGEDVLRNITILKG